MWMFVQNEGSCGIYGRWLLKMRGGRSWWNLRVRRAASLHLLSSQICSQWGHFEIWGLQLDFKVALQEQGLLLQTSSSMKVITTQEAMRGDGGMEHVDGGMEHVDGGMEHIDRGMEHVLLHHWWTEHGQNAADILPICHLLWNGHENMTFPLFLWMKTDFQKKEGTCISLKHIQIHAVVDDW